MDAGHCVWETKERQRASGGREEEQEGEQNRENKVGEESRRDIRTERERGPKGGGYSICMPCPHCNRDLP